MPFEIGGSSGNVMDVTAEGHAKVALSNTPADIGGVRLFTENDAGERTGVPYLKSPETSMDYRLRAAFDTIVFNDEFNAAAQNTGIWYHRTTTMTMAQSGGFLVTNANLTATNTTGCSLHTHRVFTVTTGMAMCAEFNLGITAVPLAGQVALFGFSNIASATARPTDGVWLEINANGMSGVIAYSGSYYQTNVLIPPADFTLGQIDKFAIVVGTHEVEFWWNDVLLGEFEPVAGAAQAFLSASTNLCIQQYNSAAVSGSPQMQLKVGNVTVSSMDVATNKPWACQMAGMGLMAMQGQNGGTMGQTAQWSNTALPTAAAGTNTTAALGTGLGGLFQLNAMATSATDVIVSSYLNPAGSTTQTPANLVIRGVWMDVTVLGAAVATTPTVLAIAMAFGHNALSLATTESASFANGTTKAPRRLPLGTVAFKVGDAIGTNQHIYCEFESPIFINPTEYVQVVAKPVVGTATASEIFLFNIGFNAYFE